MISRKESTDILILPYVASTHTEVTLSLRYFMGKLMKCIKQIVLMTPGQINPQHFYL